MADKKNINSPLISNIHVAGHDVDILADKNLIKEAYDKYNPALKTAIDIIEQEIKSYLTLMSKPTLKSRVKSFGSYYKKLIRIRPDSFGKQDLPVITDLLGIRIICAFLEDIANVEKQIKNKFKILEIEKKGADRTFSEFGYESVHVLIEIPESVYEKVDKSALPKDLVCEIQIRTILQDAWAEVEHELVYKSEFSPFDLPLRRKLASMNASLSLADIIFQEIRDYQNKLNTELECRRNAFYEKADIVSRLKLDETNSSSADEKNFAERSTNLPFVRGTIDDLLLEAIHAHNTGDLQRAIAIYTEIIDSKPNKVVLSVIYKHRGMAYFAQNNYVEAKQDFLSSVENDEKNFRSLYYIGIVYSIQNDDKNAIEYFDKSLAINEYQSHVYYRKALAEYHLCDFKTAMDDIKKARQLGLEEEDCVKLYEILSAKQEMSF